jgi:hypothetical protein
VIFAIFCGHSFVRATIKKSGIPQELGNGSAVVQGRNHL